MLLWCSQYVINVSRITIEFGVILESAVEPEHWQGKGADWQGSEVAALQPIREQRGDPHRLLRFARNDAEIFIDRPSNSQ